MPQSSFVIKHKLLLSKNILILNPIKHVSHLTIFQSYLCILLVMQLDIFALDILFIQEKQLLKSQFYVVHIRIELA